MVIQVLASSSKGNCYRISDSHSSLLLECGIPIKKIKEGCDFDFSDVAGCLVTHGHKDHCKAANDLMKCGIDVYCSLGTWGKIDYDKNYQRRSFSLPLDINLSFFEKVYRTFTVGSFEVKPFKVEHDANEPVGYLIYSTATHETLLFATDTYYIHFKFLNLNYILIEANYSETDLNDAVEDGRTNRETRKRLYQSHMSLERCIEMLKANDLSKVKQIYLLHLSGENADRAEFKRKVQEITGVEVCIA